jgi:glycosyltransferase involved in cell wall biosynthesis
MNIVFISPWFPYPPENGSKIRIYNLLKTLSNHHKIRLISFVREGEHADPEGLEGICQLEATVPWRKFNPTSWKSLAGFFSPTPRSIVDTFSPIMVDQLQRILINERPDVIVASEMNSSIYGGRKWSIPCILDEMQLGLYYQVWSSSTSPFMKLRKELYLAKVGAYIRHLSREYDACTVVSELERQLFSKLVNSNGNVYVIPNGVDLDQNRPGIAIPQPNTLIYNGALTFSANLDAMSYFLQDIFPTIRAQAPSAILKITGTVQGVDLSRLPLDDQVILSGFLPDIRPAVAEAWACIVPLRHGGGTRLKILEAMALGTPVIATSIAAEGLCVTPDKNILLADTPKEFSTQTIRLLNDSRLRDELSINGRELVEKYYGWDAIGAAFEKIIIGVTSGRTI